MSTYTSPGNQWPLLQSKTEQKFKSGLFNVSAEFIRPVGDTELPTVIETSIGTVDVWPEPTVSSGTDGFERINATGYGVWNANISEVTYGYELGELVVSFSLIDRCSDSAGCGDKNCGSILAFSNPVRKLPVILESVHIRKNGDEIPASPTLKVFYTSGIELTGSINITNIAPDVRPATYTGVFESTPVIQSRLVKIKKNVFGEIKETEVIYQAVPYVNFGTFDQITNCPQ